MNPQLPDDIFDDPDLDRLLSGHLAGELCEQRGKAIARFRAARGRARRWRNGIAIASAFLLLTTSVALLTLHHQSQTSPTSAGLATASSDAPLIQCVTYDNTVDAGAITIDGIPGRVYQDQIVEQTECFDPRTHVTLRTFTPREVWVVETLEQY